jgi:methionyl-tRNA formyltransferase
MIRYALAGDRQIAVDCLRFMLDQGAKPEALLLPSPDRATHGAHLRDLSGLPDDRVLIGPEFRQPGGIELLGSLDLDYIVGVHFPYIIPTEVLALPRIGVLNLHPALLPYNRGWHTPSWAIIDQTPFGATLHFMDSGLDTGDIVAQMPLEVRPDDTAHTLYRRALDLELELFQEAWPLLLSGHPPRTAQPGGSGTRHDRSELGAERRLDLDRALPVGEVLRTLRALTTGDPDEAAYFEEAGRRYRVQVVITPEEPGEA